MNKREFTAVYQKRGRWIVAWVEEIPGVNSQGRTLKEARGNLKEALALVLEASRALASGKAVNARREPVSIAIAA
ncbi:hypothetical protein A2110_01975 [Candidatus Jorgensenbacteria bacterium GWA1_54_12]|uniref:HicB family protein n=1 Tax=Candidatus Jorgensenbacteria bacterium GWA1_54_12 TaxID=1798468 RepID=A0A1F6BKZ1_9BACT|nr:MAG: hypothetical protein A2110_01975 [Candidatus Jorgensenbacteria bacterium GWA1_54_12]